MIYIDPPYNTGNDFIYNDNFTRDSEEELLESGQINEEGGKLVANPETNGRYHSDWLSMMYPRLKLARNLLKEDGVIFISIDDNEVHNLRKICDEVFGESNFVGEIIRQTRKGGGSMSKYMSSDHDYCITYAKNKNHLKKMFVPYEENYLKRYKEEDEISKYFWDTYARNRQGSSNFYEIIAPDGTILERAWINPKHIFEELLSKGEVRIKQMSDGNWSVQVKQRIGEEGQIFRSLLLDYTNEYGTKELKNIFEEGIFTYAKPVELLTRLILATTKNDDIILDFFSGSSTTAHAVMKLNSEDKGNRNFIMVQLPEETDKKSEAYKAGYKNICEIGKERIRRAGKKIVEESGKTDLDIGFRVLKLDDSNMKDIYFTPQELGQSQMDYSVDNIKEDRSDLDLLFSVLIDWGVDLTLPIKKEVIQGKDCYFVDNDSLCAYFGNDINEEFIKELAKKEALRFVFKDSSFGNNDDLKDNVSQIFKQLNPQAEIKVI